METSKTHWIEWLYVFPFFEVRCWGLVMKQPGFFDIDDRLKTLSAKGDALEQLSGLVDFERLSPG